MLLVLWGCPVFEGDSPLLWGLLSFERVCLVCVNHYSFGVKHSRQGVLIRTYCWYFLGYMYRVSEGGDFWCLVCHVSIYMMHQMSIILGMLCSD